MKRLFTKGFIAFAVIGLFLSSIQVFANGTGTINQLVQYLTTKDEGTTLTTRTASIDFVGAGVTATSTANNVTVNIASSVSATGTPTQVAYFTATSTLASSPAFVYDPAIDVLKLGDGTPTYTVNSSQSMAMTKSLPSFYIPFAGQNTSTSTTASTDITLSNDAGTDTTNYLDIGINSSTNTDPLYTGFSAGSGYMYNQSGDLVLATASAKSIKFLTNGTLTANTRLTIDSTGLATFTDGITQAGRYINSYTSTASSPAGTYTGTWFSGGTGSTTKPHLLVEPTGATSSGWSANGTALGVNASAGFTGNLFDFQQNGVSTLKFSGATTSPLLTMTASSGSNNAKLWFTGQGNGTDLIVGASNSATYPNHAYMISASNTLTIQGGTSASGRINFNSTLGFADQKAWQSSNSRQFFMVSENTGNAQARVTFGPTIFSPTGTTESFFTWNGAVNGVAGSTVALAGVRQSQTITPNSATPLIIGYQMINSMVASANNQTFVGIDLSSTFTPGAFTGLSAIRLRIGAGSTTTVPVQFTSGSLATTPLVGGMEFLTDKWYGTITTGTARKEFALWDSAGTSGQVVFTTTNGRLASNGTMTFDGLGNLGISGAFTAGSYTDFSNTKSGTNNGITASITNQLSSTTVTVTALSATNAQAGIVDTSAQTYAGRKTFDDGITIGTGSTATLRLKGYTVAGLPAGTVGDVAYVTDALAPVSLATVVGGGAVVVKVFFDGTNWIVQ